MNKTELIDQIANDADIPKASATRALDAALAAIAATLKEGGSVSLVGFGTFEVGSRAARTGRNPRTGESIKIDEAKVPKFRAGKAFQAYRRRGGTRTGVLPDFVIGAHAEIEGLRLLTRDATRYRTCFPHLSLIAP